MKLQLRLAKPTIPRGKYTTRTGSGDKHPRAWTTGNVRPNDSMALLCHWLITAASLCIICFNLGCESIRGRVGSLFDSSRDMARVSNSHGANSLPVGNPSIANFNGTQYAELIALSDKPVIVDFWSPTCPPCRQLKPILEQLEEDGQINLILINTQHEPELTKRFGVRSIPHLVFVHGGEITATRNGFHTRQQLESILAEH
ncbi:MAG TPA: thioredoxin family protein [Pirellulaceae bacterium]|nr:thioredoxin family protein [Pirellulaceae bacterium]HMO93077.1 thioredoxin family protein [Pirellulaceae bacterium]HMP69972.1 thioredoxin family protein [Pirellulaceae bacterium]